MSVSTSASVTSRLSALVADARTRARATRERVLVSVAERVDRIDPLEALERLEQGAMTRPRANAPHRMYWTRPVDDFSLAGSGAAVLIEGDGEDRFIQVDSAWMKLLEGALVDDPSNGAPGVGPALMGGFAFEPDGPRSARWRDFPSARMFLPRVQIAATGDACWVTVNLIVGSDGEPDIAPKALGALHGRAIGSAAPSPQVARDTRMQVDGDDTEPTAEWRKAIEAIVAAIRADTLEKAVLAREVLVAAPRDYDVAAALRHLRSAHQASYVFGCWSGESAFVGASPELLVRLEGDEVHASSLAGSAGRGATAEQDASLAAGLVASAKDRVEHEIVRRALVEGLAQLCDDVDADAEPSLLTLPQVHHLHTDVRGRLRAGHSLLELVARLHPTPAVGGEPRAAALALIRQLEGIDRGWYAAPIGWLQRGRGEFAVALRSALVTGREAVLFAGCGIVADSDADSEFAESLLKLRPMEMALALAVPAGDASPPVRAVAGGRASR